MRWPSSSTLTTADIGPSVAAASMAPAPMTAQAPGSVPAAGATSVQSRPRPPPSSAPQVIVGVNRPPGAPAPRHMADAAMRAKASDSVSHTGPAWSRKLRWTTSMPLPSSCGRTMETAPSARNAAMGAARRPAALLGARRSAQAITRT